MENALTISGLRKVYANGFEALKGIDLHVEAGDFFALLGPNGAGKSTTIGIISSLVNKTEGKVSVFGHDIGNESEQAKRFIGLVPQEFNFNVFEPVVEIIVNQAGYYGIDREEAYQRADKLLEQLGLTEKRQQMARNLSGGMKRRLMIARALVHQPKLLILDEPTAGVDIEIRRTMWDFLRKINQEDGTTIILTTHYLEEAENLCRNIAIIDNGELVENTSMKQLLSQLTQETFILDLTSPLTQDINNDNYHYRLIDDHTLEVEVEKNTSLNALFCDLDRQGLQVASLRNKTNRLEQLFMRLVEEKRQ